MTGLATDCSTHPPFPPNPVLSPAWGQESVSQRVGIQPHGLLLVLSESAWVIQQVSANCQAILGLAPDALLAQPLAQLFPTAAVAALQAEWRGLGHAANTLTLLRGEQVWRATLSRGGQPAQIYLELEPSPSGPPGGTAAESLTRVNRAIAQLRPIAELSEFLQQATQELRQITGFDRVMVYQFMGQELLSPEGLPQDRLAQGSGSVVAEAKRVDLSPYLGLHYPATDVPEPIRALYQQGMVRYVPDLTAAMVEILPSPSAADLDIYRLNLRGVDACSREYYENMGVAALLVLPLTQGEQLWGLIACHHLSPQTLAYEVRQACELLAAWIGAELAHKVNIASLNYLSKLRALQSDFLQSIADATDLKQALINPAPRLLALVGAQGAAICLGDEITLVGDTPDLDQVQDCLAWLDSLARLDSSARLDAQSLPPTADAALKHLWYTNALPKLYPPAVEFKQVACGLLQLTISPTHRLVWFRPEVLQVIDWAGDPNSVLQVNDKGEQTLTPRKSFEQWQEIVQLTSLPWQGCELENAQDLRTVIVGIVLKKADELVRLNRELARSVQELDSFAYAAAHDLKEPLRGIHNFSKLLLKGYGDKLDGVGQSRLQTLVRLANRMEALIEALHKFSRIGHAELNLQPLNLNHLLAQVLADLQVSYPNHRTEIRLCQTLPTVSADPILLREVFANLLTNAIKYNDKPQAWVEIGVTTDDLGATQTIDATQTTNTTGAKAPIFYVRDNGIGIQAWHLNSVFKLFKRLHEQHLYGGGTGAGLTIAQKTIERHGGRLWVESAYGEGSTFYFTLQN
jgi:two-component system, chemotaxis family, sensor kinase Cph1